MGGGGDFTVIVTRKEVVAGGLPMLLHLLPLSNLDLVMPPVYGLLLLLRPHVPGDPRSCQMDGRTISTNIVNDPDNYIQMVYAGHPDVFVEAVRMFYAYKCRLNFLEAVRI
ncbi:hypothetical protein CK203_053682 [Vitis vinifera]|uniref:Uncharacterized protein n=1 Tax=Vitis vinifera TaxID=29760 RepID=A0A438GS65_VITVI|nr:hypothetical protein CK203_053682 [Vitis vinifera]